MSTKPIIIHLDSEALDLLDKVSSLSDRSRSSFLRNLIKREAKQILENG